MKLVSGKSLVIAVLALGAVWAIAEADEMKGPHGGAFCMQGDGPHGGGPGPDFTMAAPMPMAGDPMHLVRMAEELDLSPDQRKQLGVIMDASIPKFRDLMFRMADSRKALEAYREGDQKDEGALRKITDEHGKVMSEMMFLGMKTHADMHALLSEEQLQKLDEFRHDRHGFRNHFFQKRIDG